MVQRVSLKLFALFLFIIPHFLFAQIKTLTGTIVDDKGAPVAGATVTIKGTKTSVVTNDQGVYVIKTDVSSPTLVVSSIGFSEKETSAGNAQKIILLPVSATLNDVVVIGYGTAKRAAVSSSIASVSEKEIKNLPAAGADQLLQGKVSGVTVSSNGGQPGGGVSVRVRGITSVNGNEPLYVIDGVALESASTNSVSQDALGGGTGQTAQSVLATLNPSDIASIDILKDASAQAIYGSRAANGVVLINTKRGKAGEGKINYDFYTGWATVPKLLPVMNLQQFAEYSNSLVPDLRAFGQSADTTAEFRDPSLLGKGTDWQRAVFQIGNTQNHQLSFSGGNGKTTYYFSGNYFNQTGIITGTGFERYAMRFNIDHQVKSWFKAGMSGNLSRSNQRIGLTDGFDAVTSVVLYNSPASLIKTPDGQYAGALQVAGNPIGTDRNPIALANLRDVRSVQSKAFGAVYGELNIIKGLTFRNEVNYDFTLNNNHAFQPYIYNDSMGVRILGPSTLSESRNNSLYWALKDYFNYNNTFGKHYVTATLGHEVQSSKWDNISAQRVNLQLNLPSLAVGDKPDDNGANGESVNASSGEWKMESYFARVNYTYDNRYSISGSIRRDGSSAFGPNNRIGYFPAASAAWTITNESFAKNIKMLDMLKLRIGAGAVGNQNIASLAYVTNINLSASNAFGAGGFPGNIGNPNLKWESVVTYNAGLDATLFNKVIDLTVDVYKKVSTDMLLPTQLGYFSGLGTAWNDIQTPIANNGKMTNTGIDVGITSYNITTKNFSWKTSATFSHYKNILNELNTPDASLKGTIKLDYSGSDPVVTVSKPGYPVGSFFGYVTDGLFRDEKELRNGTDWMNLGSNDASVGVTKTWLGDVRYKDLNGDGKIGNEDVTFIGNPNPKFTGSLTNTFTYKGIDLTIFLYGSYGGKIYNATRMLTERMDNAWSNQLVTVLDRYSVNNPDGTLPRFNNQHNNNFRISDRFIEDGSFLRIQTLSLGYNLPKDLISKVKLSNFRVYLSAQNLYTFTKYSGYDPDLGSTNNSVLLQNIDLGHYPNPRTLTIGANVEF